MERCGQPGGDGGNGGNGGAQHTAVRRHVPYRIDAHFMLTAWANAVEDEHRLLWRMLAALLRYQIIGLFSNERYLLRREFSMTPYLATVAPLLPRIVAADFTGEVISRDAVMAQVAAAPARPASPRISPSCSSKLTPRTCSPRIRTHPR